MITISKTLIEIIFAVVSLLALAVSSAFTIATIRAQLAMANVQLEIRSDRQEFARKVQQNIDANKVDIGVLKCEMADIKGFLERKMGMGKRQRFPEESKPKSTDFT